MTQTPKMTRRHMLAAAPLAAVGATAHAGDSTGSDAFQYEIQRSLPEWLQRLTTDEFNVLRLNGTEKRHSSPLIHETRAGTYKCKGCDLPMYDAGWKVQLDIGWVFFRHSEPDAMLMSIDAGSQDGMAAMSPSAKIEGHCRRCGSHIGHILQVKGQLLHCVNGSALNFEPATA